jgi:hypothetical protein
MILLEQKLANHIFPETQIQNFCIQLQGKLLSFSLVFPVRTRFSVHIQTGSKAHPVSSMMETVSLSQEKSSQSIDVIIHYILAQYSVWLELQIYLCSVFSRHIFTKNCGNTYTCIHYSYMVLLQLTKYTQRSLNYSQYVLKYNYFVSQ